MTDDKSIDISPALIKKSRVGLFWFTNDLRLHDNPALMQAVSQVDKLVCVYIDQPSESLPHRYGQTAISQHRRRFISQSLDCLAEKLRQLGQTLIVVNGATVTAMISQIEKFDITDVYRSTNAGCYENQYWKALLPHFPATNFHSIDSHTLFDYDLLPFHIDALPKTFSKFRKQIESQPCARPICAPSYLPPAPFPIGEELHSTSTGRDTITSRFTGGEEHALNQLQSYFDSDKPAKYKEVRNALDGWDNSCKFSPWLASGCLSVREVAARLADYEDNVVANQSTYWIYFELLWREYFQWYAHKYGTKMFKLAGIKSKAPLTSFYPERFQKWVNGNTPYPIVNAAMNELRATGYLSNRGRQIVASCLVNELACDWRYGAAYFEHILLDYDVASNWGNWQYLAGVGADVKEKRRFNLEKQTEVFDPQRRYIGKWHGTVDIQPLDSVDAADWPIAL